MNFLFLQNGSLISRFISWLFKERPSIFAVESGENIYVSGLIGFRKIPKKEFLYKSDVLCKIHWPLKQIAKKMLLRSLEDNLSKSPLKGMLLFIWSAIKHKILKTPLLSQYGSQKYLLTDVAYFLPGKFTGEFEQKKIITANDLYNILKNNLPRSEKDN